MNLHAWKAPFAAAAIVISTAASTFAGEVMYPAGPPTIVDYPAPAPAPGPMAVPVDQGAPVYVAQPPPAPLVEVQAVAPGPGFIWIGGCWNWSHGHYAWYGGHWALPPRRNCAWIAPHYVSGPRGYGYVRGYWR